MHRTSKLPIFAHIIGMAIVAMTLQEGHALSSPTRGPGPATNQPQTNLKSSPPKTTVYWFVKSSWRGKTAGLIDQVEEHLAQQRIIAFQTVQAIAEPNSALDKPFAHAASLVKLGKKALFDLDLDAAQKNVAEAVQTYEQSFHRFIDSPFGYGPLVDALGLLASTAHQNGKEDLTRQAISKLLVLNPKFNFPKNSPEDLKESLLNYKLEQGEVGTAPLAIETKPSGVVVYVDGKKVGRSPVTVQGLAEGSHYVTVQRRGLASMTKTVTLAPPTKGTISITMRPVRSGLFPALKRALGEFEKTQAGPGVAAAAKNLGVQVLILGRIVVRGTEAQVTVTTYDLRRHRPTTADAHGTATNGAAIEVSSFKQRVNLTDLNGAPAKIAQMAVAPLAPKPKPSRKAAAKKPKKKRVSSWVTIKTGWHKFRRWKGFWYTIGGTAGLVVAGVAVGLAVGLTRQRRAFIPAGSRHVILAHVPGPGQIAW
ncbi:MAG: PEGA domain-containing protein [Deltaproteobacteria bacterium]|nr:PEGA domain-containing protein [Deltaproteobacteria bacterium]